VVCAAGWPLGRLVAWFADKLIPVRGQWLRTSSGPPLGLGVSGQHGYLWWRAHPEGGWLVGGARWATPHLESWEIEAEPQDAVERKLLGILGQSWPGVGAQVVARGAGIMTLTCDNLPLCGPLPGRSRILACTGFGEHGLALALGGAKGVAEGILEGDSAQLPALVRPARLV
jgi:glycine/D-amino acid oxidase-like deaminating enzyme